MKYLVIEGLDELSKVSKYQLNLLPHPQEVGEINGFYRLKEELGLLFENVEPEAEEVIMEVMNEELSLIGELNCQKKEKDVPEGLRIFEEPPEENVEEVYAIYFESNYLVIMANTDKGIYYGTNTFLQLIKPVDGALVIPDLEIYDYPAYEIRCITDQTSRNQIPTIENLKKTVKFVSKFKLNYHFLYFEDGFNFKKYADLGKLRGGYTAEEVKEIQDYAKRYFVEIVPIFNSLGHVDNILLTNFPKYAHLGEFPGAATYDSLNPEVKSFLKDINQELCEAFESKLFHLGLDETFDFGKFKSKERIKEKGKGQIMLEFYNFLIQNLKENGKEKLICYYDNILGQEELLLNLPKDLIVFYWDYALKKWFLFPKKKYKKAKKLRENGYRVILSPTLYDFARNFPDSKRTIKNVVSMAKYGLEIEALGIATSVWGDNLNENLRECNYYGYLVTAEAAWAPMLWDTERFNENFAYFFYGLRDLDIIKALDCLNAYNDFHSIYPLKFYCHIWRHPFPSQKKIKAKVKKLAEILERSELALQLVAKMKQKAKRNVDNLDYLAYGAQLGIYLAKKYQLTQEVQSELNKGRDFFEPSELIEKVTYLKDYLQNLRKLYEELWLRAAKPNGLELLLKKFDAGIYFYKQKIQEIEDGIIWKDPFLKAEFITAPAKVEPGFPVFLRKSFNVDAPVKRCHIQGMCDMNMTLYFNGEKIIEMVSRMSLSVEQIKQRIKLLEITDKVKEGINVISAECRNYLISRTAANIYLELEYESGDKEILRSNSEWKASSTEEADWEKVDFNDSHWPNAKSYGPPPSISGYVTRPDIQAGVQSQDNYYYATDTFIKAVMPWVPSSLIKLGKKITGIDIF